ncbi:MAG: hypothetical protein AAF387_06195 [Pseudomonadota bacterium]
MDASIDKAYVVAQLQRASDFGLLKEAVSIVAGERAEHANVDWQRIRLQLDRILPGITEPRIGAANDNPPIFGYRQTAGYPVYLGAVKVRKTTGIET